MASLPLAIGAGYARPGMAELQVAEIDRPISFHSPNGEPLSAQLIHFAYHTADDGSVSTEVVVELDQAGYLRVEQEQLFHLMPEVRGPGAEAFEPQERVRLQLRLKSMLVPQLYAASTAPEAAGNRLAELADSDSALLDTSSWYVQSVTTDIAMPPGLEGQLRTGFRTAWTADDDIFGGGPPDPADAAIALGEPMLAIVVQVLDQRGWEYRQIPHRQALGWKVRSERGGWECYAIADEQPGLLLLYSVLEALMPAERRAEAALLITRLNQGLPVGNWEVDLDGGNVRYKTSLDAGAGELTSALVERLLDRNLDIVAAHVAALEGFAFGRLDLADALAQAGES